MNTQQTQEYHNGIEQAFKVALIHASVYPALVAALEKERDAYLGVPVIAPTKQEIDLKTIQQATAQTRELRKEQQAVLDNAPKIIEAYALVSRVHNNFGRENF